MSWFAIASLCLLLSGAIVNERQSILDTSVVVVTAISGLFLVYRFNHFINCLSGNESSISTYVLQPINLTLLLIVTACLPYLLFRGEFTSLLVFGVSALLGFLYAIPIGSFRLKSHFITKNTLIGFVWGMLVLIGAGQNYAPLAIYLFWLVVIQVFIGGVIRDVPDLTSDKENDVKTIPVLFGAKVTIVLMLLLNVSSLSLLFLLDSWYWSALVISVVLWRFANLVILHKHPDNRLVSQQFNLGTCVLILAVTLYFYLW